METGPLEQYINWWCGRLTFYGEFGTVSDSQMCEILPKPLKNVKKNNWHAEGNLAHVNVG